MSKSVKTFIFLALMIILAQAFSLSSLVLIPAAQAAGADGGGLDIMPAITRVPIWNLPVDEQGRMMNVSIGECECDAADSPAACAAKKEKFCMKIPWIVEYISAVYKYGVVLGSILAVIMLMIGGALYVIGGMNQGMITKGKEFITGATIGLVLLLGSYLMMNAINPNLVRLKPITIEVPREVVTASSQYCKEAVAEGFTIADSNWDKGEDTCGQTFKITKEAKGTTAGTDQTCVSRFCKDTTKNCVTSGEEGKMSCLSVVMYGDVTYPSAATAFSCNHLSQALAQKITDSGFYVKSLFLTALPGGKISKMIEVGQGAKGYFISGADITTTPSPDAQLYLWIQINDASWPAWFTEDDWFAALAVSKQEGSVKPAIKCTKEGYGERMFTYSPQGTGTVWEFPEKLTWNDVLAKGAGGVKWDINVTNDFYDCMEGETTEKTTFCKWATAAAPGIQQYGQACANTTDCAAPKDDILGKNVGNYLVCSGGKCGYGSWGDKCGKPGFWKGYEHECGLGFTCGKQSGGVDNQCVGAAGGKNAGGNYLQRCDGDNENSCAAGMKCREHKTVNLKKGESNQTVSASNLDCYQLEDEKIDEFLCAPALSTQRGDICHCEKDNNQVCDASVPGVGGSEVCSTDCPWSAPICVDRKGNDNFCTQGMAGQPCTVGNDCAFKGMICDTNTNTCRYEHGFWSDDAKDKVYELNYYLYKDPIKP